MPRQPDVIVVGAGPAGSTAAAVLARHGVGVMLVDREHFPRDKACGDVVPLGCFLALESIGLATSNLDRFQIRRILLEGSQRARRTFELGERHTPHGPMGTCVVSRTDFDHALRQHALACGADYRALNVKGPIVNDGRVTGIVGTVGNVSTGDSRATNQTAKNQAVGNQTADNQTVAYRSRIVIGADGATSAIARGLEVSPPRGRKRDDHWAVALRGYVNTDVDLDDTIELAFLDDIQPGYAWFFPMATRRANVGVGMRSDFYKRQDRTLHDLLTGYLARPDIAARIGGNSIEHLKAWPVPFFSFEKQRVFDGALLAGDAGGFVHPITAAGIYPAIMSGKCAAEAAMHALERGDTSEIALSRYSGLWQDALAADFEPAVTAGKLATLFPHLVSAALLLAQSKPESHAGTHASPSFSLGKF